MPTMPGTFRSPHAPTHQERASEGDRLRGSARARGYDSAWDRASIGFLAHNPVCLACAAAGLSIASKVTDHVIPHKGDRAIFWDRSHWQPACQWHHDAVKQRLEQLYASGAISSADLWLTSPFALALAAKMRPL